MASYTELKREALKLRKRAQKLDIPGQYLAMADAKIDKAIFSRTVMGSKEKPSIKKRIAYKRATEELITAIDVLRAHTTKLYERNRGNLKFIYKEI